MGQLVFTRVIPEFDHLKFLSKVKTKDEKCCWEWLGATHSIKGYGQHYISGQNYPAHRISYTLFKGKISSGLIIDHICRNRSCVNPDHLREFTARENTLEVNAVSPARLNKDKKLCVRGHEFQKDLVPHRDGWKRFCPICNNIRARIYRDKKNGNSRKNPCKTR